MPATKKPSLTSRDRIAKHRAAADRKSQPVNLPAITMRPGDELERIIRQRFHVASCSACQSTAQKMNERGVEWCRANLDELAEEIHSNAQKRIHTAVLSFAAVTVFGMEKYKSLIVEACDLCEAKKNDLVLQQLDVLRGPRTQRPSGWNQDPNVVEAHRRHFQEVLNANVKAPDDVGDGRGIVVLGGGHKYFTCTYILVRLLREIGCTIPVEWVYLNFDEMTPLMKEVASELPGVELVDLSLKCRPRCYGGWEAKVWSIVKSRFSEVMFLDADQLPVRDPEYLFDDPHYKEHGAILWADIANHLGLDITKEAFQVMGLDVPGNNTMPGHSKPSDYRPVESGQLLIDKRKCWKALQVCLSINNHSDFFYPQPQSQQHWHIYGDKSTFYLAWEATETPYAKPNYPLWLGVPGNGAFGQPDMTGRVIFQHRCQPTAKYSIYGEHKKPPGIEHLDRVDTYLAELRRRVGDAFRAPIVPPELKGVHWYGERHGDYPIDRVLASHFHKKKKLMNGLAVECGALDGRMLSCTKALSDRFHWKTILLEPDSARAIDIAKHRPRDTWLHAAIVPTPGRTRLKVNEVVGWSKTGNEGIDVPGFTWDQLAELFFPNRCPDLFVLDIEGNEIPILESMTRNLPSVLCIEHAQVGMAAVRAALPRDYKMIYRDHVNAVFEK